MAAGEITPKQQAFVEFYFACGFNATRAAIEAGYSDKNAAQQGYQLLQIPSVRAAIDARFATLADDADAMLRLLVRELVAILASDLTGLVEWDSTGLRLVPSAELSHEQASSLREVTQIVEERDGERGASRIARSGLKQHDKVRAAALLARLHGLDRTHVEVSGSVGITLARMHELADAAESGADDGA